MKATDVKAALRKRHSIDAWVCIEEAFSGFATMGGGIDLLAIGVWRSAKVAGLPGAGRNDARNPIAAYEVKVSRADMRRELYGYRPGPNAKSWKTRPVPPWPGKAAGALERSHYFVFAVPAGLLKDEEIERREPPADGKGLWLPPEAGLVEVSERGCSARVEAPRRAEPEPWGRHEVAELLRHVSAPNRLRNALADLGAARANVDRLVSENDALEQKVEDLEDRLGRLRAGAVAA